MSVYCLHSPHLLVVVRHLVVLMLYLLLVRMLLLLRLYLMVVLLLLIMLLRGELSRVILPLLHVLLLRLLL